MASSYERVDHDDVSRRLRLRECLRVEDLGDEAVILDTERDALHRVEGGAVAAVRSRRRSLPQAPVMWQNSLTGSQGPTCWRMRNRIPATRRLS